MMETCVDPIATLGSTIGQDAASVEESSTKVSQESDPISDMNAHPASDQDHAGMFESRYISFKFQANEDGHSSRGPSFEGVNTRGDALKILRLKSRSEDGTLEFVCEHWSLSNSRVPILEREQTILTKENDSKWLLYTQRLDDPSLRVGRAAPAAFTSDCQLLRIGVQLFRMDDQGEYTLVPGLGTQTEGYPAYVEELAIRGSYIVVACRRNITDEDVYQTGIRDEKMDGFALEFVKAEKLMLCKLDANEDEDEEEEEEDDNDEQSESESSHSSSTGEEEEEEDKEQEQAYESSSVCSTEHSDNIQFEDDAIVPWDPSSENEQETSSEPSSSSSEEAEVEEGQDKETDDSDLDSDSSSESDPDPDTDSYAKRPVSLLSRIMSFDDSSSEDEDYDPFIKRSRNMSNLRLGRPRNSEKSLDVFDTSGSVPTRVFHFTHTSSSMAYASPPAMHPSEALVVWPFSGGDLLFADFVAKTYFVKTLVLSTPHSQPIFVKCQFSLCGQYLHIASLEGHRGQVPQRHAKQPPTMKLALLLFTYRLSSRKLTRSPPALIHRTKVNLGSQATLSVSRLPYTLTWTQYELFFTCSTDEFKAYRICLFSPNVSHGSEEIREVLIPKKTVPLPVKVRPRVVYYCPSADETTEGRIIIGAPASGLKGARSPPVGCFVREREDLGGWGESGDRLAIPENSSVGRLDYCQVGSNREDASDLKSCLV